MNTSRGLQSTTAILAAICLAQTGCQRNDDGTSAGAGKRAVIQNKGSDTMVNVAQAWAETYGKTHPDVSVEVSGGGSGVGIAALIRGTIEIATASRDMKASELESTKKNTGKDAKEFTVGYDALAIYVQKDNPLDEITLDQIAKIYAEDGTITKWSELGITLPDGAGDEIIRVSRQSSSGTYEFLRSHVLNKKDFKLGSRDMNGSKEVVELVANTPTAIGYSGMGYATPEVKMLKVKTTPDATAYAPSVANALSKDYAIARSLHLYTLGEPTGAVKDYVDWILSPAGQAIVEESGYVPLTPSAAIAQ